MDDEQINPSEEFGAEDAPAPPSSEASHAAEGWKPDLNPGQWKVFDDAAENVLAVGEKGSGKSISCGHKIIRHCYENSGAYVLIGVPYLDAGAEGIWHDLETLILPQWKDGIDLQFTAGKLDPISKKRHRWIQAHNGEWSKIVLVSIPHETMVEDRVKGPAPSMIYIDELTNCGGPTYWRFMASQLGRRRGITGPQQYVASCNPKGPSHWVYKIFYEDCIDKETGKRNPQFSVHHIPVTENTHRLPAGYVERLKAIWKTDPIEYDRLVLGKWIDRPDGKAMFRAYWVRQLHVRGDAKRRLGIVPDKRYHILVGHDPGPVNYSIHFLQMIPTKDKGVIYTVFDELNYVGQAAPYRKVVADLCARIDWWNKRMGHTFTYKHISDEAAFSKKNSSGSFEVEEIQQLAKEYRKSHPGPEVRIVACPKGPKSVPARSRLIASLLAQGQILVSDTCPKTIEMFDNLASENENREEKYNPDAAFTPRRSVHIHPFDSMSYPIFFHHTVAVSRFAGGTQELKPEVYSMSH